MPPAKKKTVKKNAPSGGTGGRKSASPVHRQTAAIITFMSAILLLFIVFIPGGNVWYWMHCLFRGLFGVCAFALPALMIYISVIAALDKPVSVSAKLWQCVILLTMVSSIIHVFVNTGITTNFFSAVGTSFTEGVRLRTGGVTGAILGYPLAYLFTDLGAKIILFLLAAVFLMLITGTTIISLFHAMSAPVKKTKESIESAMITGAERRAARQEKIVTGKSSAPAVAIDVDIGDGYSNVSDTENNQSSESLEAFTRAAAQLSVETAEEQSVIVSPIDVSLGDIDSFPASIVQAADAAENEAVEDDGRSRRKKRGEPIPELDISEIQPVSGEYHTPPLSLLDNAKTVDYVTGDMEQQSVSDLLLKTLKEFGISATLVGISRGPTVTRYELEPSAGVKISKITGLVDDLALRLATMGVRIEAPIPNKAAVGIEVPNKIGNTVCLKELLDSREFRGSKSKLTVALGKDIAGNIIIADLAKMPHLLIAGTTGSGKSVCTNAMIQSVLYRASPKEVRMILIDPKQVEFRMYNGIPHLLVPVVTDPRKAAGALGWAVTEMLQRYKLFAENNVRDLEAYNELVRRSEDMTELPLILIVIDELSDLMMAAANEVEDAIIRLAQMARAAGMHLVIATQRPSVDVITGLIKANIPSRLALTVASGVDSRTILDTGGAERLLGRGDMLFMPLGMPKPIRVQGCFVSGGEVEKVVEYLRNSEGNEYDDKVIEEIEKQAAAAEKSSPKKHDDEGENGDSDDMLPQAIEYVVEAGVASTSMLQRRLRLGYARAGRLIDIMEKRGIVGPYEGSKPRQVLLSRQQWLEMNMARPDIPDAADTADGEDGKDEPW